MLIIIYLLCFIFNFTSSRNRDLVITSGVDKIYPDSVAMGFYINVNNTGEDCQVECTPDRCCLTAEGEEDCDVLEIVGGCFEDLPGGTTKTIRMAAPLLNPYERQGYCIVYLDSRPGGRQVVRDTVKISFNTSLEKNPRAEFKPCGHIDQDPLNNCKPVDCDTYYNGRKPYFSKRLNRCIEATPCISDDSDVVYDPKSNRCRRNTSITEEDMQYVRSLARNRPTKDILIIENKTKQPRPNGVYKAEMNNEDQVSTGDSSKDYKYDKDLTNKVGCKFFDYFATYKDTLTVLGIIIIVQCCVICIMIYCLAKNCRCEKDKTLVSRFFNYRHDVSVTTPLIATSNNGTDTTYQYLSESSTNVDKKIKCYKACERNKPHNAKVSMSDDILAKCLNRRDWTHKPKSEAIVELKPENFIKERLEKAQNTENQVNFESEVRKLKPEFKERSVKIVSQTKSDNFDGQPSSEQELQCHVYHNEYHEQDTYIDEEVKKIVSKSTEKGAQACFSNDSIDDFLSERGMVFLAADSTSKYTFTSESTFNFVKNSCSEVSGKTSKNNIVRNVLSMLHRKKSKHTPSSDPGGKKDEKLNLELLHMSQASVFSSNESEYFKKAADSRSSL